jgi:hypothetical protein
MGPLIRSCFIALVCLTTFIGRAQDTLDLARYKWGTPLSVMQERFGLRPVKIQEATVRYSSTVSFVGKAAVGDCQFEFTDGKFSGVAAMTSDQRESHDLLKFLKDAFGPGESREPLGWQWFSGDTHIWFDIARAGDGYLYWYSLKLQPGKEKP